jgi:DNA-binding MarR family transcriptional regulator
MSSKERSSQDEPDLGATIGFMRLLWSVDHALQSLSKRMEINIGVTGPQRLVLRVLGRLPNSTAGAVSSILRTHPSTLTGVFRRLEERGLINRLIDPNDRRRSRFSLTSEGEALNAHRSGTVEGAIRRALARLSEQERAATERALITIAEELKRDAQ